MFSPTKRLATALGPGVFPSRGPPCYSNLARYVGHTVIPRYVQTCSNLSHPFIIFIHLKISPRDIPHHKQGDRTNLKGKIPGSSSPVLADVRISINLGTPLKPCKSTVAEQKMLRIPMFSRVYCIFLAARSMKKQQSSNSSHPIRVCFPLKIPLFSAWGEKRSYDSIAKQIKATPTTERKLNQRGVT